MGKCDCGMNPAEYKDWFHAFDCPAHFDETNRKLAGISKSVGQTFKHEPQFAKVLFPEPTYDPRNHFGRNFYPKDYYGFPLLNQQTMGWAAKIRRKIFKRFGIA